MHYIYSLLAKWDKLNKKGKMFVGGAAIIVVYLIISNV